MQKDIFNDLSKMMPHRPKRWCYYHYKKAYQKAVYPHELSQEEKKQLQIEVRMQLALGRQLGEIREILSKQEPYSLAFPNTVYAIVYLTCKKYG